MAGNPYTESGDKFQIPDMLANRADTYNLGDVIGDITSRRGRVQSMEARGNAQVIKCMVPLAEMFGYATDLRSRTQGRATYTMQFSSYEQAPKTVSEEVVAKSAG